jgi:hypothetical protein
LAELNHPIFNFFQVSEEEQIQSIYPTIRPELLIGIKSLICKFGGYYNSLYFSSASYESIEMIDTQTENNKCALRKAKEQE